MAAEVQPMDVQDVRDEERFFGGDVVWWTLLLVVSVPLILYGLSLAPQIVGFLILSVGGILAGVAFAQVTLRLPYVTSGFMISMLIVLGVAAVIAGVTFMFNLTLPVPTPPPDVMFKAPGT
jgi:hypothetical protein